MDGYEFKFSNCTNEDLNQQFTFNRLQSSNPVFVNFGQFVSIENKCLEMDKHLRSSFKVFIHSFCWDTWEILETGALKNVADDLCIGRDSSNNVSIVDCNSEDTVIWIASVTE